MEDQEYIRTLPKKRVAAGALFHNRADELLIVKPRYREPWLIPGGVVERDESPKACCLREIKEEISLDLSSPRLLSVHYFSGAFDLIEGMVFLFDGGLLDEKQIGEIRLEEAELLEFQFVDADMAFPLLEQNLSVQIRETLQAAEENHPVYLENGKVVR